MECIIKNNMIDYLLSQDVITSQQHGFLKNRSTNTNLLETVSDWTLAVSCKNSIDAIYIDFSRAFDSVVSSKLLYKLRAYGINGKLFEWISLFLNDRSQCVVLENCISSSCPVISGVVQGSVLGPLLFLIYINDITEVCSGSTKLKLFADDAKFYSACKLNTQSTDLQTTLDRLTAWAAKWQLKININKCFHIHINSKRNETVANKYFLDNAAIITSNSVTDLGIEINSNLDFSSHISNIIAKARQRSGTFFRGFVCRKLAFVRKIFVTYIRPCLEYNSNVWNPSKIYLIDKIESVQRQFTKKIPTISNLSYEERLKALNLDPLELRRLRFDLIQYYKILNNLSPLKPENYFSFYFPRESSRTTEPKLIRPALGNNRLFSSFFFRSIDAWNCLPTDLRHASSVDSFKNYLLKFDLSKFLGGSCFRR
jgi:hypothetical protein